MGSESMKGMAGICALLSFVVIAQFGWAAAAPVEIPECVQQSVAFWAEELVRQDGRFDFFAETDPAIEPLDTGANTLMIRFESPGKTKKGYMIIANRNSSEQLLEYGVGGQTLFEPQALTWGERQIREQADAKTLQIRNITPVYQGLESNWTLNGNNNTYYINAESGEWLPFTSPPRKTDFSGISPDSQLSEVTDLEEVVNPSPTANLNWVIEEKQGESSVRSKADQSPKTAHQYVARLWNDEMIAVYPIQAVHDWDNNPTYVGLVTLDAGLRFLPEGILQKDGVFINFK
jgi:hypothetical protein